MRGLTEYGLGEWATGMPLVHGFKRGRNALIERAFRGLGRRAGDALLSQRSELGGKTVISVIAYNVPWTIALMLRAAPRLPGCAFVIFDNSRNPDARRDIERICRDRDTAYLSLPPNPERHPCRSHGLAMNWAFYHVIKPLRPRVFAYFDHDLVPTAVFDPASMVVSQPVYGVRNESRWGWNLWAGFSMFDYAAIEGRLPDFNHDVPRNLDTGGRNWLRIYRHLDRSRIRFASFDHVLLRDPESTEPAKAQVVDGTLLHISGAGHGIKRQPPIRPAFYEGILDATEKGAGLGEFLLPEPAAGPTGKAA
jgi:hypothetical protein